MLATTRRGRTMAGERVRDYLDERGVAYDADVHPRAVDAQRLAATEHVSGWLVAKPVLVIADGDLVMTVIPGPAALDLDRAAEALAGEVRLAEEREFRDRFPDCEAGAEPPFGALYGMRTLVDPVLRRDPEVVFRAGTHDTAMRMTTEDFLAVLGAEEAELAVLETS